MSAARPRSRSDEDLGPGPAEDGVGAAGTSVDGAAAPAVEPPPPAVEPPPAEPPAADGAPGPGATAAHAPGEFRPPAESAGPDVTREFPPPIAAAPDPAPRRRRASRRAVTTAFTTVFGVWVLLDQVTKELATRLFATDPVDLGFVRLVDVRNPNAAFGIPGFPGLFPLVTVVVVVLVLRVLPGTDRLSLAVAYGLVTGGAVGNVLDRLFRAPGFPAGSVVDFVDLGWWPVFNLADTGICIGAAIVALQLSRVDREEREEAETAAAAQPSVRPEPRPPHA